MKKGRLRQDGIDRRARLRQERILIARGDAEQHQAQKVAGYSYSTPGFLARSKGNVRGSQGRFIGPAPNIEQENHRDRGVAACARDLEQLAEIVTGHRLHDCTEIFGHFLVGIALGRRGGDMGCVEDCRRSRKLASFEPATVGMGASQEQRPSRENTGPSEGFRWSVGDLLGVT